MTKKSSIQRPYPPPIVDIEELSYQTTIAVSTIRLYVKNGWLPPAHECGNKKLWIMSEVMAHVAKIDKMEENGESPSDEGDEYDQGIDNVAPAKDANDRAA